MKKIIALVFLYVPSVLAADYIIDKSHSEVMFKVRHLGISTVTGRFDDFEGTFNFDKDNSIKSSVEATINISSINTNEKKRDEHLKACDFFCEADFGKMSFKSKNVSPIKSGKFQIVGDLTIRDITNEVTLDAEHLGNATDPWGNERAGFIASAKINRKDYGLTWNKITEAGGVVVGSDVTIELSIQGVKKPQQDSN